MKSKFVYPCSIKIPDSEFSELSGSIFYFLLVFLAKSCWDTWRSGCWLKRDQVNIAMMQNFVAQFVQLLKCWLYNLQLGIVMQKNQALSIDQSLLQAVQFSVHFNDLLSLLLRCNALAWIKKIIVAQTGSRLPNSDHGHFVVQVWLWGMLWSFSVQSLSWSSLVVI